MIELDELKLLRGKEITIDGVGTITPIAIEEIVEIGEKTFYQYLNHICFDIDDLNATQEEKNKLFEDNITSFHLIVSGCMYDNEYLNLVLSAFKFFFHEDIQFFQEAGFFYFGDLKEQRYITMENFEDIKKVIKLQNCLLKNDILEENPKDERTRILLEKRRKAREKLARAKARDNDSDSENITFADLVSIMCANANGVNYENVWNMNYYMFQNQFQRMKLIDDFDISIRSLLAGAKSDDIELKHYISHL